MAEAVPRPAATVALIRDGDGGVEILMLQRNLNAGFAPGAYVFPGGALDAADDDSETQILCSGLTEVDASRALGVSRGGLAYWVAAIRESFEEAGLLLAYDSNRHLVAFDDGAATEKFRRHRHALNQGVCSVLDILRDECLEFAADQLAYTGHWITPATAPRRYDTRFFVAEAPPAQTPAHDNKEIISHLWITSGRALDRHRRDGFKLSIPTIRMLEEYSAFDSAASLMRAMRAKHDISPAGPRINGPDASRTRGDPGNETMAPKARREAWKA